MKERIVEGRMYRIGQIVPSSNTTMETEIPAMLHARARIRPERFTFHASRMRMHKVTKEELAAMNREGRHHGDGVRLSPTNGARAHGCGMR